MWELDYKDSWALKSWCFWTVVLGKTLESHLDCKEIQPVHPKGDQSWMFIGRTDVEAETPRVCPNPCASSRWCHPTISSSVFPFSSCPQSFPASVSFQVSQLFTSYGLSIGASASTSVLPVNIQDWFPLGLTSRISLKTTGLSRVFSNTTLMAETKKN